ncbi:hypothetical protein M011DRAFT_318748 [Sporormia fimetaria CBS 119925]|uniref:Uncharacterized protein n=1 Tax=Sporormia fimetaria CBS 119925 TaxID=1340428 RepID=A0A6A6UW91_9PLEO|nr:hypothetical protein M011DRAFT_318748 [Sporormia fimetaria CBS 119925]
MPTHTDFDPFTSLRNAIFRNHTMPPITPEKPYAKCMHCLTEVSKHRLSAPAVDLPQRGLANTQIAISIRSKNTDQRNKVCYGLCMVLAPLNMALALSWVTVESFGTLPKERLMLAPIC